MRGQLTRTGVVDVARRLIEREGLDALSLRRLAAELEVTAPALYAYVEGKDDLLRAIAEVEFQRLIERFDAIADPDPIERLRALSAAYVEHALASPELFRVMFLFPPELASTAATGREMPLATKAFGIAGDTVMDAVATGRLTHPDPGLAALTLWTGAHGVATVARLGLQAPDGGDLTPALLRSVVDTLLAGMGAKPRRSRRRANESTE